MQFSYSSLDLSGSLLSYSEIDLPESKRELASPLKELSKLDFTPFTASVEEFEPAALAAVSESLGKENPGTLTGMKSFLYHSGWGKFLTYLGLVAGSVFFLFMAPGAGKLAGVACLLALAFVVMVHVGIHSSVAAPFELRVRAFELANQVRVTATEDKSSSEAIQELGHFPRGDRSRWVRNRLLIQSTEAMLTDLELGVYCYEDRSTDSNGKTSYSTRTVDYAFLPLPRDISIPHWFDVDDKALIGGRTHVPLSAAFDRKYAVRLEEKSDAARLFVTQALAPDVQALLLELPSKAAAEFQFTPEGVIMRSRLLPLDELGKSRRSADEDLWQALRPLLAVVHEVFEQLNSSYKQLAV